MPSWCSALPARRHGRKKGEEGEAQVAQDAELELGAPGGEGRVQLGDPRGSGGPGVRMYHVCDDGVMSTRRLVEVLAEGMGRPARLLSVPRWAAMTVGTLLGKGAQVRRLYGSLEVDGSDFCRDYGWRPPVSLEDGLREMGRAWRDGGGTGG